MLYDHIVQGWITLRIFIWLRRTRECWKAKRCNTENFEWIFTCFTVKITQQTQHVMMIITHTVGSSGRWRREHKPTRRRGKNFHSKFSHFISSSTHTFCNCFHSILSSRRVGVSSPTKIKLKIKQENATCVLFTHMMIFNILIAI